MRLKNVRDGSVGRGSLLRVRYCDGPTSGGLSRVLRRSVDLQITLYRP